MELVIASKNPGKIREIRGVLALRGLELLTCEELGDWSEPEETGATFAENAEIKARTLLQMFGRAALADDSGLVVDALGGRPGVHSSRYAGEEGDADRNMARLLSELKGVLPDKRAARFVCVAVLAFPKSDRIVTRGECEGTILKERRGSGGFGYDPVFQPSGFERSMAELSLDEKNSISHRGKALLLMREELARILK
ncbi:MAG TPA: XTP/dITP diphosphatase [Candidatus Anoxymicrobiaceae bacterium]|jgi:XTP/dITP diphosphohydrolase